MTTVLDVLRDRGYGNVDESALVRAVQDALPARTEAADPITPEGIARPNWQYRPHPDSG